MIVNIDDLWDVGEDAYKSKKETSGTFTVVSKGFGTYIVLDKAFKGTVKDVDIPDTGNTWHTHPRECPNNNNCSILPPSGTDMSIYAERWSENHLVLSRKRIYYVQAHFQFTKEDSDDILDFYSVLEKWFDKTDKSHAHFDELFILSNKLTKWFTVYQFDNPEYDSFASR